MKMKKLASLSIVGMLVFNMVGCDNSKEEQLERRIQELEQKLEEKETKEVEEVGEETKELEEETKEEIKIEEKKKVKEGFYIGEDGIYHCTECDAIAGKEDYNNGVCSLCGGHYNDPNYGQCYDCGEYKPISEMEFNGRSYHCGCADEDDIVCAGCGVLMSEDEAYEFNYQLYCSNCYDEMTYESYDEQYDENGYATHCYNCDSSDIEYIDEYNYICHNCGIQTQ